MIKVKIITIIYLLLTSITKTKKPKPVDLHKKETTRMKIKKYYTDNKNTINIILILIILSIIFTIISVVIWQTGSLDSTNYYYRLNE